MKLHDSRQLGPLVFRDPLLLCSALYFLLYFDASGFLRLGLLAAFLHECGHILVYCALLRRFPVIEVTMTGFCMRMDAPAPVSYTHLDVYKRQVHSKLTLITKKSKEGYSYITQIGTGNYNEKTSELYTDYSFLSLIHI